MRQECYLVAHGFAVLSVVNGHTHQTPVFWGHWAWARRLLLANFRVDKKKESKKMIHHSESQYKSLPFPSKFIDMSPLAGIIKASIFASLKFFLPSLPPFFFFFHPPNFPLRCHCDSRFSPGYALEAAHCGICLHSTDIQCYQGQTYPNISWKNTAGMPAPRQPTADCAAQHQCLGCRDSRTPCAAVPPQSQGSLFLRSLLYYAPPLLKKCRHLVCSVVEKVSFVLLHCLFVQWPAKGSVGSGGDSHCS